jgi:hypothetical protein
MPDGSMVMNRKVVSADENEMVRIHGPTSSKNIMEHS